MKKEYKNSLLAEILSSKVRAEIFRLFFGLSEKKYYMREIERRSGFAIGTVQKELKKMVRLDLLTKQKNGNRVYYKTNKSHPLYMDIHNIVIKTNGLVNVIHNSLKNNKKIKSAFVFGSIARNKEKSNSDIDLMVIGNIGLREITKLLIGVSEKTGREINPFVLTEKEFSNRKKSKEHFITNVIKSPKMFIIGSKNEFEAMAK